MAKKRSAWLIGCGVGCAFLLLIGIAGLVGGAAWVSSMLAGFNSAIESREQLEAAHGASADFVPWADGTIPPDRLQVFLSARADMAPARRELASVLGRMPSDPEELRRLENAPLSEKLGSVLRLSRAALGMGSVMGAFFAARNQTLLQSDMGLGEYTYLYVIIYDSWLGLSPVDSMFSPGDSTVRVVDEEGVETVRKKTLGGRVRDELRQMLENQLAAARQLPADSLPPGWISELEAELTAMAADPLRRPFQDGLPAQTAASLESWREQLEDSFDPSSDPFELLRNRHRGRFSIQAE